MLTTALAFTLFASGASARSYAASPMPSDPCALRDLVAKLSADIAPLVAKALEARPRACLLVVHANALAREGHGSDAEKRFDEAMEALPEIANALELAKRRATSMPTGPAKETDPKTHEEAAQLVMKLVREAKPKRATEVALAFEKRAPKQEPLHEAFEVATLTALVRAERTDEAIARAAKLPASDAFVKARAWVVGKAQRYGEARDLYTQLATTTIDPALKAEAAFLAAFTAYDVGDLDDARARFVAVLPIVKGTPYEANARWYLAFCDLLRGKWSDAIPVLELLVAEMPSEKEALKHRYWLARARIEAKDKAKGRAELTKLADSEPIEFYGMLARRRLDKKPLKGAKVAADAMAKLARDDEEARKALLLWNLGLDDEARTLARGLGDSAAEIGLQHKVGDATFGWRRGARFIPFPRTNGGALVKDARWRVSYASPWRDTVDDAAKKHALPASFIYAIMRTESGFDPRAISIAGAQGVIQLMPSAARGSAGLAGRSVEDARRIFEPQVAIDLGAALLAAGKKEFGSMSLSAAAYNGGAHNLVVWMKAHRALDVELFIERISFKETRDYVKRIAAVEATYRALEGGELALDLPASIPEPPATFTHFPIDE